MYITAHFQSLCPRSSQERVTRARNKRQRAETQGRSRIEQTRPQSKEEEANRGLANLSQRHADPCGLGQLEHRWTEVPGNI